MGTLQTLLALVGLIYVLCVIVQAVQEVIKSALDTKANTMAQTINKFMGAHLPLDDVKKALAERGLDITALEHFSKEDFRHLLDGIESLEPKLKGIVTKETATFEQQKDNVAAAYDGARANFQKAYSKRNKLFAVVFSFAVVIALDANLISMYQELAADQLMAQAIAGKADKVTTCGVGQGGATQADQSTDLDKVYQSNRNCVAKMLNSYPILVRWYKPHSMWVPMWWGKDWDDPFVAIAGLLLMGILVSLGAPFWNDILKGITGLNNTLNTGGKKVS